jgi:predicted transposase YbfD/YdcC
LSTEHSPPQHQTVDKGHGRLETRSIWLSTELNDYVKFPHCRQVGCIERVRQNLKTGKISRETAYILTSLTADKAGPEKVLAINRAHWGIENRSHYVRDWSFDEDRSTVRTRNGPRMMATLRNLVTGIFRLLECDNIAKALRNLASSAHRTLRVIGL